MTHLPASPQPHAPVHPAVVVVGSFNQDLTYRCQSFPQPGETVVGSFSTGPGGKGSNQAVACARAGVPTAFVGAVGTDGFGAGAMAFWRREGLTLAVQELADCPTGNAGILVDASGQNEIIVALGSNLRLLPEDLPVELLAGAQVLVCQNEIALPTTLAALQVAKSAGVVTIWNPAPMEPAFDLAWLKDVSIFTPNETEFATLVARVFPEVGPIRPADMPPAELHRLCRRLPVPTTIVTLGSKGCLVSQQGSFSLLPVLSGITVVDTTGAGDAFVGGLAAGLVKGGGDVVQAAAFGNVVAGLKVTRLGTAPAMPHAAEIMSAWRQQRGGGAVE